MIPTYSAGYTESCCLGVPLTPSAMWPQEQREAYARAFATRAAKPKRKKKTPSPRPDPEVFSQLVTVPSGQQQSSQRDSLPPTEIGQIPLPPVSQGQPLSPGQIQSEVTNLARNIQNQVSTIQTIAASKEAAPVSNSMVALTSTSPLEITAPASGLTVIPPGQLSEICKFYNLKGLPVPISSVSREGPSAPTTGVSTIASSSSQGSTLPQVPSSRRPILTHLGQDWPAPPPRMVSSVVPSFQHMPVTSSGLYSMDYNRMVTQAPPPPPPPPCPPSQLPAQLKWTLDTESGYYVARFGQELFRWDSTMQMPVLLPATSTEQTRTSTSRVLQRTRFAENTTDRETRLRSRRSRTSDDPLVQVQRQLSQLADIVTGLSAERIRSSPTQDSISSGRYSRSGEYSSHSDASDDQAEGDSLDEEEGMSDLDTPSCILRTKTDPTDTDGPGVRTALAFARHATATKTRPEETEDRGVSEDKDLPSSAQTNAFLHHLCGHSHDWPVQHSPERVRAAVRHSEPLPRPRTDFKGHFPPSHLQVDGMLNLTAKLQNRVRVNPDSEQHHYLPEACKLDASETAPDPLAMGPGQYFTTEAQLFGTARHFPFTVSANKDTEALETIGLSKKLPDSTVPASLLRSWESAAKLWLVLLARQEWVQHGARSILESLLNANYLRPPTVEEWQMLIALLLDGGKDVERLTKVAQRLLADITLVRRDTAIGVLKKTARRSGTLAEFADESDFLRLRAAPLFGQELFPAGHDKFFIAQCRKKKADYQLVEQRRSQYSRKPGRSTSRFTSTDKKATKRKRSQSTYSRSYSTPRSPKRRTPEAKSPKPSTRPTRATQKKSGRKGSWGSKKRK